MLTLSTQRSGAMRPCDRWWWELEASGARWNFVVLQLLFVFRYLPPFIYPFTEPDDGIMGRMNKSI